MDSDSPLDIVAFVKPTTTDPNGKVHKQNNHTNACLSTIGDQLIRIEDQIAQTREDIKNVNYKNKDEEKEVSP